MNAARGQGRRHLSRRGLLSAGFGVAAGAALAGGCGDDGSESGDIEGEITVWTWPDNDKTFEKTIPIFQEKNPGTTVKVQAFAADQYNNKLLATLVSGSGPDVAMVEITYVANYKGKRGFLDLADPPYAAARSADRYVDFAWDYAFDAAEDRLFVLPKNTGPGGLFYRRDVLEHAGLPTDPSEVHTAFASWDDYLTAGRKLAVRDERWLVDTPMALVQAIRAQAGLSYFDESGTCLLTEPVMVEAVEYARRAHEAGLISPFEAWSQEWGASIQTGAVATFLTGNWFGGLVKSVFAPDTAGAWGVAFAPEFEGNAAFNSGGDFIGVLASSRNPATAWAFTKFVSQDPDSLRTMYRENDLYPAWEPALDKPWMNEPDDFYAGQNVNEVFAEVSRAMRPPLTHPSDGAAVDALTDAVTAVVREGVGVKEALAAAKRRVDERSG